MSKKLLRTITENVNKTFEQLAKQGGIRGENFGLRTGKLQEGDEKLLTEAEKRGDTDQAIKLMETSLATNTNEVYFNLPDLHIRDNGSVKTLAVSVYSAEAKDNILLHRLFSKVRTDK